MRIAFWTMVAASREAVLDLVDKHRDTTAFERAATLAWTQAQVQLHHLGIDPGEAGLFQRLAGHLLYAGPALRPSSDNHPARCRRTAGLWPMGISGDLPIVLLRIADIENLDIARQLLQAHEYWRMKQLAVDLVILNERASSYVQDLQIALETQVRTSQSHAVGWRAEQQQGRVFVLRADLISPEARALLASVARVVLVGQRGSLADQLDRVPEPEEAVRTTRKPTMAHECTADCAASRHWSSSTGWAALPKTGGSIVTILGPGQATPAPWINVIANPAFGFQVADRGQRLHLVGQQPREPADAVVERSGQRSPGRGVLSARRRYRRAVVPDGAADPRRRRHLCGAARLGLQPTSSMPRMASPPNCCNTFRWAIRSRFRASRCATRRAGRGISR